MSYTIPTASQFKTRFPEFASTADATVSAVLTESARRVDTTWAEGDYQTAIMYLAAHVLQSNADAAAGGSISSVSIGPISVSYSNFSKAVGDRQLLSTDYGRIFAEIRASNFPPIMVV